MKSKEEITQKVIDACQGTCHSLDYILTMYFEEEGWSDEDLDLDMLDEAIFVCDDCGWWCEVGDYAENLQIEGQVCRDCGEYNYNEDGDPI